MAKDTMALEAAIGRLKKSLGLFSATIRSDIELIIAAALKPSEVPDLAAIRAEVYDELVEKILSFKKQDALEQKRRLQKKPGRRRRTIADSDVTEEVKDIMRLRLLEAKLESDEAFDRVSREVLKELGLQNCRSRNRTMGGLLAHTQGKHRIQFIKRLLARVNGAERDALTERLMKACQIDSSEVNEALTVH